MQVFEIPVEPDKQTLCQGNVFCRNNQTQCERTQHEDNHGNPGTDKDRFRVVLRCRFLHVHHVNTHHLHSGVEKEDSRG